MTLPKKPSAANSFPHGMWECDSIPFMIEFKGNFSDIFFKKSSSTSADILIRLFLSNSRAPYFLSDVGAGCRLIFAASDSDDYHGTLSIRDITFERGLNVTLYRESSILKVPEFMNSRLLELNTGTKGSNPTGRREGIEVVFSNQLIVPSKAADWALKVAWRCSLISAEHLPNVYNE